MATRAAGRQIVVVALGSTGDLNPMLGIAVALERRGHDVTFIANPVFARHAAAGGVRFTPLGVQADYDFVGDPSTWRWWRCLETAFRRAWLPNLRPVYDCIAAASKSARTVIVANVMCAGAQLAQERLGTPLVMVSPSPLVFQNLEELPNHGPLQGAPRWLGRPGRRLYYRLGDTLVDLWIGNGVNEVRSALGLSRVHRFFTGWISSAQRIVGLWPAWYARPQIGWPPQTVLAGFLNYDRGDLDAGTVPPGVLDSECDPEIVFTCGSATTHVGAFLDVALGVHRILRRRVLVVTDGPTEVPAGLPDGVEVVGYVPFRRILPRVAAVVHHGGIGTSVAALAAGTPQVMVPLAFDQFHNAERFAQLGVARKVSRLRFGPRRVARALGRLLESESVAERCRHWQDKIDCAGALRRVCEVVETL